MLQHEMQSLIERYIDAYNRFDVPRMIELLDRNVVFENYSGSTKTHSSYGIAEFRELAEKAAALFTEREQRITAVEFQSVGAIVNIAYHGILAIDLSDELKAGEIVRVNGKSVFHFQDNRISYIADYS